ncbi:MAG: PPC domain-containing protein, partial [Planctomycetes bacterium]|nr:PPC domain-containing protein [Planctomycetota bacterium]
MSGSQWAKAHPGAYRAIRARSASEGFASLARAGTNPSLALRARIAGGAVLALCAITSFAGNPELSVILPRGGQRGTAVVANFHGARLEQAREILFYRPGVSLSKIEQVSDKLVRCTLAIAPDAPIGIHPMRLVTASGISPLRLFSVGNCPESDETEPNNTADAAQRIALPATVNGTITNEDVDYFSFELPAAQRINIEIEAMRLGDLVFDPQISVLDARGAVLASADDTTLVGQDAAISYSFAAAGVYFVRVREASYRGAGNARYRLHVGAFPRPQAVFPPGGAPGQELELRWIGDADLGAQKITLPAEHTDFELVAATDAGVSPSPIPFRLNELSQTIEVEPNDAPEAGTEVGSAVPGALAGVLDKPGDIDWYRFAGKKGQVFDYRVYGRALRSPIDSIMGVRKLGGSDLKANDDAGGPDSAFRFTFPEDGTYALGVRDLLRRGGELYVYRVEITPVRPTLRINSPQRSVSIPRGNRNVLLLNASRQDFGGALHFELAGLPTGARVTGPAGTADAAPAMHTSVNAIPVVIEAAPDAPLAATLVDVIARTADDQPQVEGRFHQAVRLSEYRDNTMCEQVVTKLAKAVTQPVPFSIELVEPADGDPKNADHLVCIPKPESSLYGQYDQLEFFVHKEIHL